MASLRKYGRLAGTLYLLSEAAIRRRIAERITWLETGWP